MVEQNTLLIDPTQVDEHRSQLKTRFKRWHEDAWSFVSYQEFLQLSDSSFLAYIKYLLDAVSEEGVIDVAAVEHRSREISGEYFSDEKFHKAVSFIAEDQWDHL